MNTGDGLPAERPRNAKHYLLWLPPLIAFAGLAILLALGRDSWVYHLPHGENNSQVLSINSSLLQGTAEVPKNVHVGTALIAGGWVRSVDPSLQLADIAIYLDGRPVAETSAFSSASLISNGQSVPVKRWVVSVFVKDIQPGPHSLVLGATMQGRDPVALRQTAILVLK